MRKPTYEKSEIIEAAQELQRSNKSVTGYAICKSLGGGRPQRLEEVWKTYLLEQQLKDESVADEHLSSDMEQSLESLSNELTTKLRRSLLGFERKLNDQASSRIEKQHKQNMEHLAALQEKLDDANSIINHQENSLEQLLSEKQSYLEREHTIHNLEKKLIKVTSERDSYVCRLEDKEAIINEQAARINALLNNAPQPNHKELLVDS